MSLKFDTVYRVMVYDPQLDPEPYYYGLAIGPRPFRGDLPDYLGGHKEDGFEWIPNSPSWPYRREFLRVESEDDGKVVARSVQAELSGLLATFTFEPLTLDLLEEIKDDVEGYEELVDGMSDDDLQLFFREGWMRDDWTKNGDSPEQMLPEEVILLRLQDLAEAKAAEIGDVRFWKSKNKWMEKTRDGWVPVDGPVDTKSSVAGTVRTVQGIEFQKQQDDEWEPVEPGPRGELAGEWKDKAEGLPEDSKAANWDKDKNDYSLERKAKHSQIRHDVLKNVRPVDRTKNKPRAVITMGVPASGKSEAISDMMNTANYAHVDPDRIREQLPEFQAAVDQRARNGGSIVADETNDIADEVLSEAMGQGMNVILEGVGSDTSWYENKLIPALKNMGYEVSLMMVHEENADAAVERAEHRGKKTGRFVPERHIRRAHEKIPKNFERLAKLTDSFAAYESGRPPKKMLSKEAGGAEVVHDPDAYDRFKAFTETEWYEILFGTELKEGDEEDKPTEIPWDEFLGVVEQAWITDQAEIDSMPDKYTDGVQIPLKDIEKSRKLNKE